MELKKIFMTALCALLAAELSAFREEVKSPDGNLKVEICAAENGSKDLSYGVWFKGESVYESAKISMDTSAGRFGEKPKLAKVLRSSKEEILKPLWGLKSAIRDNYNEAELVFDGYSVVFRIYDDAVCYRFKSDFDGELTVFDEDAFFPFAGEDMAYAYPVKNFLLHFQQVFEDIPVKDMKKLDMAIAPLCVRKAKGKIKTVITDADVYDYPSLNFSFKDGDECLHGLFAKYPLDLQPRGNALHPKARADYIAKTSGRRAFPWRAVMVFGEDRDMLDSSTVYKLSSPCRIGDTSWIKTGTCAWEWWHAKNLEGVDFETGFNGQTYKYYLDFAAKYKMPFMLIDGGWLDEKKWAEGAPIAEASKLDIAELCAYGKARNVDILVWVRSRTIYDLDVAEKFFAQVKAWGAAGVKVDFVERDDQEAMRYYENVSALAAKHKLLVDWHGCPKSTGMYRAYPNVINEEGVRGGELNKMTEKLTPDHNVSLLFTRMAAGPFDYTPGALRNTAYSANPLREFAVAPLWPMSRGTRAHQVSMFVLYYEPLKMLIDSPTEYEKYPPLTKFMAECPTTWDDTAPLAAEFNKYAAIARRKGDVWYVGAMTDWEEREIEVALDFLDAGKTYAATIVRDTQNSNRLAKDCKMETREFKKGDALKIKMAKGGGFAMKLERR